MHAQSGTVGAPEFNGTEVRLEVTFRFPEAFGFTPEIRDEFRSAMSGDVADILTDTFNALLIPEAQPEIGVRVL